MKKKSIFLLALSIALILATSINSALAYFTTYVQAKGGYIIHLGGTDIEEEFSNWTKRVVITNDPNGQPVYVRARAFAGNTYTLLYDGNGWKDGGDGYYYYDKILLAGVETSELSVRIDDVLTGDAVAEGDHFNVIVIYETTPVQYDANGKPYANWSNTQRGDV